MGLRKMFQEERKDMVTYERNFYTQHLQLQVIIYSVILWYLIIYPSILWYLIVYPAIYLKSLARGKKCIGRSTNNLNDCVIVTNPVCRGDKRRGGWWVCVCVGGGGGGGGVPLGKPLLLSSEM